jgi:hypothetical protein
MADTSSSVDVDGGGCTGGCVCWVGTSFPDEEPPPPPQAARLTSDIEASAHVSALERTAMRYPLKVPIGRRRKALIKARVFRKSTAIL